MLCYVLLIIPSPIFVVVVVVVGRNEYHCFEDQVCTMASSSTTMRSPSRTGPNDIPNRSQLGQTWIEFMRALNSTQPFNPFTWVYRLGTAATAHVYHATGCADFVLRYQLNKVWRPIIPMFALTLMLLVVFAYFASIRVLVKERWCCENITTETTALSTCLNKTEPCMWMLFHDFCVIYLSTMVIFHYCRTTFQSPGVVLSSTRPTRPWKAIESQGGLLGWNSVCDEAAERKRVELYGTLPDAKLLTEPTAEVCRPVESSRVGVSSTPFPSPDATYCYKCGIVRPARCHHCSTCHRCVLGFDHHCVWLNNCIGYNNYRSFLLTLLFLMLSCWYGVALLFWPFYEPLRAQVKEHGIHFLYSNGTGFLDLPPPTKLAKMVWSGDGLEVKIVIDLVYPLMLGVGATISAFLGMHVKYVLKARTSLEHRILLDQIYFSLVRPGASFASLRDAKPPPNPFDQGGYRNLLQILGSNPLWIFLPVTVQCPPPYVPGGSSDTKDR
jgi:hypothetical protein